MGHREIGASGHWKKDHPITRSSDLSMHPTMALRRFRPPLEVTVEVRDGEPVRIAAGELRGEVASVSGPWRSSGDWWNRGEFLPRINADSHGTIWARDEWDLALSNGKNILLYRIFCELDTGKWFIEGSYD